MISIEDNGQQPLSTQGSENEKDDQLGGTTNLSPDDLQKEGAIETTPENPDRLDNPDDLHEIQADDDLNEPGEDEYSRDEEATDEPDRQISDNPASQTE